jgi:hypothetical protein
MILEFVELGILICFAIYVERWRAGQRRRQGQAWERLVAQLQPNWYGGGLKDRSNSNADADASAKPEEIWNGVQGAEGLWSMYENAQVMMEMADFAARNSATVDKELIASLRRDAMQIRLSVLLALSKYACDQVNETTGENVAQVASIYADMVGRTAELMQMNGPALATFASRV